MSASLGITLAAAAAAAGGVTPFAVPVHTPNLALYHWVLVAHSAWRWVVLVSGAVAVLSAAVRLSKRLPWAPVGGRTGRFFSTAVDVQVLMGAALYLVLSPLTTIVVGGAISRLPRGSQAYFFAVEHPAIMIAAFFAVHISSVVVRRARTDAGHQRRAVVGYGITLLIILAGIPWWRPLLRF